MKAVTFQDVRRVTVEDVPDPAVEAPTDAVVRVSLAGICGSDLHLYHGDIPMLPGASLGHELVGTVESVGEWVRTVAPGDRVVGTFHIACGVCRACRRGDFHQCSENAVLGFGPAFGGLSGTQAERARIPYADVNLRAIPTGVSDEQALFCGDILTTAFGAVRNAGVRPGESVAVVGCGPVGIMAVHSALAFGAARVFAIDLLPERTAIAERLGAVALTSSEVNPERRINELTHGEGADVVIEAVGGPRTIDLAFRLVRGGGRVSAVGVTNARTFEFPLLSALTRDLTFRIGLANVHRDIDTTLALVAAGRIDPTGVISHRLPLSEAVEGYRLFDQREATKVVLTP